MATYDDYQFSRVYFNDGEGVDPVDFNRLQQKMLAVLPEIMLFHGLADSIGDPTDADAVVEFESSNLMGTLVNDYNDIIIAPRPNAAFWFPHPVTARTLICAPGPIAQIVDEPSGSNDPDSETPGYDARIVMGMMGGAGNLSLQTAVGDATNPRIDIIEVKLEAITGESETRDFEDAVTGAKTTITPNKRRFTRVNYQIKQGTPAALPSYPTPSTGYTAMAAVWVPATHNAVHAAINIRDMRFPLGCEVHDVQASNIILSHVGANPWAYAAGTLAGIAGYVTSSGAAQTPVIALCPVGSKTKRVLGVGVIGAGGNDTIVELVRVTWNPPGNATITVLAELDPGVIFDATGINNFGANMIHFMDEFGGAAADQTVKGTRVANRRVGTPLWANSYAGGPGLLKTANGQYPSQLGLRIWDETGAYVNCVRWFLTAG